MQGAFAFVLLASLMPLAVLASDEAQWRAVAERSLMAALADAYPRVSEWAIEPLLGKRQEAQLANIGPFHATVVHVGKRSAVRVTREAAKGSSSVVWFDVRGMQSIPSARTDIRARTSLVPQMSDYALQDAVALDCSPIESPEALTGMRTTRTVRAGEPICIESIERRPAVARGEDVTVTSTAGGVTIVGRAIAQRDGGVGEVLEFKSPSSGEIFSAAVTGEREVAVHD
jgi:flagella basal body P-ring formation protein FlgA